MIYLVGLKKNEIIFFQFHDLALSCIFFAAIKMASRIQKQLDDCLVGRLAAGY